MDEKASKELVEEELDRICITEIGEEYRILWQADDGGNHVVIAFEEECPQKAKDIFHSTFMGWRLIKLVCPKGYLEVFYPLKKDKERSDHDRRRN
jgi:hypothetical protein